MNDHTLINAILTNRFVYISDPEANARSHA